MREYCQHFLFPELGLADPIPASTEYDNTQRSMSARAQQFGLNTTEGVESARDKDGAEGGAPLNQLVPVEDPDIQVSTRMQLTWRFEQGNEEQVESTSVAK